MPAFEKKFFPEVWDAASSAVTNMYVGTPVPGQSNLSCGLCSLALVQSTHPSLLLDKSLPPC